MFGSIFNGFGLPKSRLDPSKVLNKSFLETSWNQVVAKGAPKELQERPRTPFWEHVWSNFDKFASKVNQNSTVPNEFYSFQSQPRLNKKEVRSQVAIKFCSFITRALRRMSSCGSGKKTDVSQDFAVHRWRFLTSIKFRSFIRKDICWQHKHVAFVFLTKDCWWQVSRSAHHVFHLSVFQYVVPKWYGLIAEKMILLRVSLTKGIFTISHSLICTRIYLNKSTVHWVVYQPGGRGLGSGLSTRRRSHIWEAWQIKGWAMQRLSMQNNANTKQRFSRQPQAPFGEC